LGAVLLTNRLFLGRFWFAEVADEMVFTELSVAAAAERHGELGISR
jgi:hypothetical protein